MLNKKIERIKELIARNQIENAINELKALLKNTLAQNEIILYSARFQDLVSKIRQNVIDYEKSQVERNKIISSLLELLDNLTKESSLNDVIVDIGEINHPSDLAAKAEIRFSISNSSINSIKITSIILNIVKYEDYKVPMGTLSAGPLDEYFLHVKIEPKDSTYELIDKHFILHSLENDGFFLKLDALEGYKYYLKLECKYKELGSANFIKRESNEFIIAFPVKSIEGLLEI